MGKKRFIDPKQSTKFQLVHRSQRDIRIADEEASNLVLRPIAPSFNLLKKNQYQVNEDLVDELNNEEFEDMDESLVYNGFDQEHKKEDATNFGIYFRDVQDYDYQQHLKTIDDSKFVPVKKLQLPSDVFASEEQEIGLMHQTEHDIEGFDMDDSVREVLNALDDEAYVEDEADNYFDHLDKDDVPDDYEEADEEPQDLNEWERAFRQFKKKQQDSDSEDSDDTPRKARTMTTSYSMSSSVLFRNDKLTLLDDQFDKVLEEYDDENIGELDPEDESVLGVLDVMNLGEDNEQLDALFDDFLKSTKLNPTQSRLLHADDPTQLLGELRDELRDLAKDVVKEYSIIVDTESKDDMPARPEPKRERWDVETVHSGYTNIYNRPTLIREVSKSTPQIKLSGRNRMPVIVGDESEEESEDDHEPGINKGEARPQDETPEQKRERKNRIKEEKRIQRMNKKATKNAFKKEGLKMVQTVKHTEMQKKVQTII
ncbi:hypothetical protein EDD86DRAFT_200052 [Gorgonomyces haynaldii]|nr:hypothetical protein EDD86DRAFT_200052 [Gorgonomyces haynaldii]